VVHLRSAVRSLRLDLATIVRPILASTFDILGSFKTALLYYSDRILAIYVEAESRPNFGHIFAICVKEQPTVVSRVITALRLTANSKLFVRHTAQYLYYGTHTGIGEDGHHKWKIAGVSLDEEYPLPGTNRPLLFENFHGTDIGSTVAFEIFNEYFYAVSNQGTFEVEEVDWTSFYHCIQFPLNKPINKEMKKEKHVYRRQHEEGPIHDSWTDLSLQRSEYTNDVMIIESRREWEQASSRQSRTFYTSKFHVSPERPSDLSTPTEEDSNTVLLPDNDLFVDLLDSSNKPNWMPTPAQYRWMRHPEFTRTVTSPHPFILAKTKFRAYNHSCTSFLDLVEDDRCCNDPSKAGCLRLRVGSRHESSLNIPPISVKSKGRANEAGPVFEDHVHYRNSPIHMWPPPASRCPCSKRLHDIMNPPLPTGSGDRRSVTGVLDDRTLVYMVKPGRSYGASDDSTLGTVVVVDFTRPHIADANTPPSAAATWRRVNSEMEAQDPSTSHWQWTIGQERRCKARTCR
jgi:hypothetical protein